MNRKATTGPGEEGEIWKHLPRVSHVSGSSLDIKRSIEDTLVEMHHTLDAINARVSFRPMIEKVNHFFATPAGKTLLLVGVGAAARRRPLLTAAACGVYLFSRKPRNKGVQDEGAEAALGI